MQSSNVPRKTGIPDKRVYNQIIQKTDRDKQKEERNMDLTIRPRRLRGSDTLRRMVRETRLDPASLIYPMFVMDGENTVEEISALPGQYRYTVDRMEEELIRLSDAGVDKVMFFGIPAVKDEIGSQAYNAEGIVQRALRRAKKDFPNHSSLIHTLLR